MINIFEVAETNEMIEKENLDVRTITLGISLLDCIDSDLDRLNEKIYHKIYEAAKELVATGEQISREYGIPIVNKRIAVTPIALIGGAGGRLYPAQIVPLPNVQPFPHRHLAGRGVGAPVDLHGHGLHLLHNFPLCLAGKRPLDLSAGERVPARGDTGLPIGVSLAVAGVRALVDAPRPVCGSFRHDVPPFSIDTPGPPVVH